MVAAFRYVLGGIDVLPQPIVKIPTLFDIKHT